MKALILNDKVIQVSEDVFEVHPSLHWEDAAEGCIAGWIWDGLETVPVAIPEPSLDELKQKLADIRYSHETGGTTLNGIKLNTERDAQAMINAAYTAVQIDPTRIINWKSNTGDWVQIDNLMVKQIATAVIDHVQACFDNEMRLGVLLELDKNTDLNDGWPA